MENPEFPSNSEKSKKSDPDGKNISPVVSGGATRRKSLFGSNSKRHLLRVMPGLLSSTLYLTSYFLQRKTRSSKQDLKVLRS